MFFSEANHFKPSEFLLEVLGLLCLGAKAKGLMTKDKCVRLGEEADHGLADSGLSK